MIPDQTVCRQKTHERKSVDLKTYLQKPNNGDKIQKFEGKKEKKICFLVDEHQTMKSKTPCPMQTAFHMHSDKNTQEAI